MKDLYRTIDHVYATLGIQNVKKVPRKNINTGSMERKLNTDFSTVASNRQCSNWSSGLKIQK